MSSLFRLSSLLHFLSHTKYKCLAWSSEVHIKLQIYNLKSGRRCWENGWWQPWPPNGNITILVIGLFKIFCGRIHENLFWSDSFETICSRTQGSFSNQTLSKWYVAESILLIMKIFHALNWNMLKLKKIIKRNFFSSQMQYLQYIEIILYFFNADKQCGFWRLIRILIRKFLTRQNDGGSDQRQQHTDLGRMFWKGAAWRRSETSSCDRACSISRQNSTALPNSLQSINQYG